jgi:hypothetical protein
MSWRFIMLLKVSNEFLHIILMNFILKGLNAAYAAHPFGHYLVTCCTQFEFLNGEWYYYLQRHLSFLELFHNQRMVMRPLTIVCHHPCK